MRLAQVQAGATVSVRRAPQEDLPRRLEDFDRVIVSGSKTGAAESAPWIDRLLEMVRRTVDLEIPYLGVCFGHQMLARAFGGPESVRKAAVPEFGWVEIQIQENSSLMHGLPQKFHSFAAHFDEVAQLPLGFKVLANSGACAVQACQLQNLPVFGIQFHPEKNLLTAEKMLAEKDQSKDPPSLFNRDRGRILYREEIALRIFGNFLSWEMHDNSKK